MITVIIATYNGINVLQNVLNAYRKLESPDGGWNLVIIDNGSTDQTKDIIASFSQRLPLTYLFEPRRGKNVALNTGLSSVSGDLIVFTDDDVLPQPNWLRQLRSAADSQPSCSIFGGPILPKWESPPDAWLLAWVPLGPTFAILPPSEEGPINPRRVFGGNMTVRADVFQRGYRFDETVGPKGSNYAMGSETAMLRKLGTAGLQAWHCKDAVVYHIIRSFQMNEEWVLSRAKRYGRGQYWLTVQDSPRAASPSVLGVPLHLLIHIAIQSLRVGWAKCGSDLERVFKARWQLHYLIGRAVEARLVYREPMSLIA